MTSEAEAAPLSRIFKVDEIKDGASGEIVVTAAHVVGDVVLARQPAVGAVPGELAVDVDSVHALGAADVDHDATAQPRGRDGE